MTLLHSMKKIILSKLINIASRKKQLFAGGKIFTVILILKNIINQKEVKEDNTFQSKRERASLILFIQLKKF